MWLLLLGFCPSTQYNGPFEPANQGKRALATARVEINPFIIIISSSSSSSSISIIIISLFKGGLSGRMALQFLNVLDLFSL